MGYMKVGAITRLHGKDLQQLISKQNDATITTAIL